MRQITRGKYKGHFRVTKTTKVFKKVKDYSIYIENPIYQILECKLTVGTIVFNSGNKLRIGDRKCRANKLTPVRVWNYKSRKSHWDLTEYLCKTFSHKGMPGGYPYTYILNKVNKSIYYDECCITCGEGLHFFFDIKDALVYS